VVVVLVVLKSLTTNIHKTVTHWLLLLLLLLLLITFMQGICNYVLETVCVCRACSVAAFL